uniref:Uncharacterized protein n=1 Tax=Aegilops tauschii subsp. strangulata TaxID=200361 RepID=A0A452YEY9_AEGTS
MYQEQQRLLKVRSDECSRFVYKVVCVACYCFPFSFLLSNEILCGVASQCVIPEAICKQCCNLMCFILSTYQVSKYAHLQLKIHHV